MRNNIKSRTKEDFFLNLRSYFQGMSDKLSSDKESSKIFPNAGDKGVSREDLLKDFFNHHMPRGCEMMKGGFIFDSYGAESSQIDLFVTDNSTLQFKNFGDKNSHGKSFNHVQGCLAAISVKSKLDKKELLDSLENLASIPRLEVPSNALNPNFKINSGNSLDELFPLKVIFAYDGIDFKSIFKYMQEYYGDKSQEIWRLPRYICVNNKYLIKRIDRKGEQVEGKMLRGNSYYPTKGKYIGALSLLNILFEVQGNYELGNGFIISYREMFNKIPFE